MLPHHGRYFNLLIKNYWMRSGLVIFRVIKVDVGVLSLIETLIILEITEPNLIICFIMR